MKTFNKIVEICLLIFGVTTLWHIISDVFLDNLPKIVSISIVAATASIAWSCFWLALSLGRWIGRTREFITICDLPVGSRWKIQERIAFLDRNTNILLLIHDGWGVGSKEKNIYACCNGQFLNPVLCRVEICPDRDECDKQVEVMLVEGRKTLVYEETVVAI